MKKILSVFCVIMVCMLISVPLWRNEVVLGATTKKYYVSTDGNDNASGSKDRPFKTIQKAIDVAKAGSVIYVNDGTYSGAIKFKRSGTKGKNIVLKAVNPKHALITIENKSGQKIIDLNGKSYIQIEGFEIGNVTAKDVCGIYIGAGVGNVVIKNNYIHDIKTKKPKSSGTNGIICYGEGSTEKTAIHDISILENEVCDNVTGWSEAIAISGNVKKVYVNYNIVHDNTNIGIDFYGNAGYCKNPKLDQPRNCEAYGNIVYNNKCKYAANAGIYIDGAKNTTVSNNYVFNNIYGIEIGSEEGYGKDSTTPVTNIKVFDNIIYNNPKGGIRVGGYDSTHTGTVKNCDIYENVLSNNGDGKGGYHGEIHIEMSDNIRIYNNTITKNKKDQEKFPMVVVGVDVAAQYITNLKFEGNVYNSTLSPDKVKFNLCDEDYKGLDGQLGIKKAMRDIINASFEDELIQIK